MEAAFGNWLAGFAAGEGCFSISSRDKERNTTFSITLRDDDGHTLESIQDQLRIGTLQQRAARKQSRPGLSFVVSNKLDCRHLVEELNLFPLRNRKQGDFELWREAVLERERHLRGHWEGFDFLTGELQRRRKYRGAAIARTAVPAATPDERCYGTSLRRQRELLGLSRQETAQLVGVHPGTFAAYERGRRPMRFAQQVILTRLFGEMSLYPEVRADLGEWLAGFLDAEGSFNIHPQRKGRGYYCRVAIRLRDDDGAVLAYLQKTTGLGTLVFEPGRRALTWVVGNKMDCLRLVSILAVHPLRAKKRRDSLLWAEATTEWASTNDARSLEPLKLKLEGDRRYKGPSWDSMRSPPVPVTQALRDSQSYFTGSAPSEESRGWARSVRSRREKLLVSQYLLAKQIELHPLIVFRAEQGYPLNPFWCRKIEEALCRPGAWEGPAEYGLRVLQVRQQQLGLSRRAVCRQSGMIIHHNQLAQVERGKRQVVRDVTRRRIAALFAHYGVVWLDPVLELRGSS